VSVADAPWSSTLMKFYIINDVFMSMVQRAQSIPADAKILRRCKQYGLILAG
jgi:hypothetical protein